MGPLLYVSLELGRDQMVEVKCGYNDVIATALKRCAARLVASRMGGGLAEAGAEGGKNVDCREGSGAG